MKFHAFTLAEATLAAILMLMFTVVALLNLYTTEEGTGFVAQLQPQTQKRLVREISRPVSDFRVNPNRADAPGLAALPGIGLPLAEAIVRFREVHGPFHHLSDLQRVPGIGPHRLERMLPYLTLGEEAVWSTR